MKKLKQWINVAGTDGCECGVWNKLTQEQLGAPLCLRHKRFTTGLQCVLNQIQNLGVRLVSFDVFRSR